MFMDLLEKVYAIVEEATIATLGIGCENWRKCKCEDCVLLRKMIIKTLQRLGYNRRQMTLYTGLSKSAVGRYLSDYEDSPIISKIRIEISRKLSERGVSLR